MKTRPAFPPPRILSSRLVWVLLAVLILVPFFVPVSIGLRRHPVIGLLGDQLHIPLLAAVTLLLYWKGPLTGRLLLAAAGAAVTGALIEVVQKFVGRAALFNDFLLDLVGIGMVMGLVLWRGHGRKLGLAAIIVLLSTIPYGLRHLPREVGARRHYIALSPVIDDFEGTHMERVWTHTGTGAVGFPPVPDGPHGPSFVLNITGAPPPGNQGARMRRFPHDWRAFRWLELDARCVRPDTGAAFGVWLEDYYGLRRDAFVTERFRADSTWRTFRFPLRNRRADRADYVLDLGDMESLVIFILGPRDSTTIQIDDIRLVK